MKIRNIFNSNRDGVRYTKEMQQRLIQNINRIRTVGLSDYKASSFNSQSVGIISNIDLMNASVSKVGQSVKLHTHLNKLVSKV